MVKNGYLSSYHLVSFGINQHLSASKYCYQIAFPDTIYCVLASNRKRISQTSGKHMANRISTLFLSFITELTSPPIQRAALSTFIKISSLSANFLIVFLSEVIVSHHVKQGKIPHSIPIIYGIVGDFKGESFDTMFFKFIIGKYTGNIF